MSEPSLSLEQRGYEYGVKHLMTPQSGSLLDILAKCLDASHEEISHLLQLGAIYVGGARQSENLIWPQNTYMRVHTKPRRFPINDGQWHERIVFENENFVVLNKPSALPCHPSVDNIRENVLCYLVDDFKKEFFLTHRLDVPTNGLLVIAKTKEFQSAFNNLLQTRGIHKIYRALCTMKKPSLGLQHHYMEPSPRAPKTVVVDPLPGYSICQLEILSVEEKESEIFEAKIKLLTGRTHQIRAQLSKLGSPIRGDKMYGAEKIYAEEKIDLTACELSFADPLTSEQHHFKI